MTRTEVASFQHYFYMRDIAGKVLLSQLSVLYERLFNAVIFRVLLSCSDHSSKL